MASNLRFLSNFTRLLLHFFLVTVVLSFLPSFSSAATQITLAWDANSEPDLEGYRLYSRQLSQEYNYALPDCDTFDTSCTVYSLEDSVEYCFIVRAYDKDGNESSDSNEVCQASIYDIDDDQDGFTENQGDCDDADASINPGAAEVCGDNVDQNCDGVDLTCPTDIDDDQDGFTENQGDCDDADANINPGAAEVCGDNVDQNCDGRDELCANEPPVGDAGPDQRVAIGAVVLLNGSNSTSSDDSALSYSWLQKSGERVQLSDYLISSPTFQAPMSEQALEFDLTVTDVNGMTTTDSCIVNVSVQNEPPTSSAGSDKVVTSNHAVILDGSGSMDDGEFIFYSWSQTEGATVTLSDPTSPTPEFISPAVGPEGASLTFLLTVTDQGGLKDTDSCIVNVISDNQPPEAITDEYVEATTDTIITLNGTLSTDIDDGIKDYRWCQLEGPPVTFDNPKAAKVNFNAPVAGEYGSNLLFALKVKDKGGLKKSAKCSVFVQPTNSHASPFTITSVLNLFQKGPYYQSKASVFVVDKATGAVVKDVEVKGHWSLPGVFSESDATVIGYTSGAGEAKLDSERFTEKGTIKFTVTHVSKDGQQYEVNTESTLTTQ